ncbi:MAG: EamA family transporter [Parvularculaceae bacterium]|nr:EamA family transporter [Parvularculaceae bacterium]
MTPPTRRHSGPAAAGPAEWTLLALLIALGSSSFTFIHAAIETMPPQIVAVGRLWIAAIALYIIMRAKGRRFPPLLVRTKSGRRPHLLWAWMGGVGIIGYSIPFLIFPWAQQYVESGLAGVYMAFMPLWTLGLAYFFADEKLNARRIAGFLMGFAGVLILMGPELMNAEAMRGVSGTSFAAQGGLLVATLCYAVSVVMSRRAPATRPRVFTAGIVLMGAVFATPSLLFTPFDPASWSAVSIASVFALGLGPTALAGIIIIMIIRRAGASFMALGNYVVPAVAVILGALIFHERLEPPVFLALAVILAGVAVSQSRKRPVIETGDALAADIAPIVERSDPVQKSS